MNLMDRMLPRVEAYLAGRDWSDVPDMAGRTFRVSPLAQGEYNLNYRLDDGPVRLVLRVNMGTQIGREDQIDYEYRTLVLLRNSGVTPLPYVVDDSRKGIDRGVLIMSFLPGGHLDYPRDLEAAAALFATVHQVPVADADNHLIREDAPLSLITEECAALLKVYVESELSDPDIRGYLGEVLHWAEEHRALERYYQQDPWPCIVNTEVNANNFIVDRGRDTVHLVDWEMPRWGDPSQDLCHFCSPLTTLWKTDYRMGAGERRRFFDAYRARVTDAHLKDTLADRIRLRDPFVRLRGISWSAMGWVAYQTAHAGVKNPDTWATLGRYMDPAFIRGIFDPILRRP